MLSKIDKQEIEKISTRVTNKVLEQWKKPLTDHMLGVFINIFATKDEFKSLEQKVDDLRISFDHLQTSVDGIGKKFSSEEQEKIIENYRLKRLEDWAGQAGGKLGINFEC